MSHRDKIKQETDRYIEKRTLKQRYNRKQVIKEIYENGQTKFP